MSVLRLLVLGLAFGSAACGTSSGRQAPTQGSAGGGAGIGGGGGAAEPRADAGSMPEAGTPVDTGSHVMTWVPPYRIDEAQVALQSDFGGLTMKDGISYLGLQFWIVDGPSTRLDNVTEADILWFRDWGKTQGVKVLLCLHNYVDTNGWNWPEAVRSYRDNQAALVAHLLAEIERLGLDGIDLDLEGIVDPTPDETAAFHTFAQALADGLHPKNKVINVASFHGMWNAPNWNWWPTLLPIVDGIEAMGYEQSGLDVDYAQLVEHAAVAPEKLMIGVPSHMGQWLGHSATEHLDWIVSQSSSGVAIWDAALRDATWRQRDVWDRLVTVRNR